MANDLNNVTVSGNLTRDPELRQTTGGTSVANLGIAVNKSRKVDDEYVDAVSFFDVTVWGNYAELVARKLQKGDAISLTGEIEQQRWEAEDGSKRSKVVIIARQIVGAGMFRSKDDEQAPLTEASEPAAATEAAPAAEPSTDDIPF